jgi:hypothetical protein
VRSGLLRKARAPLLSHLTPLCRLTVLGPVKLKRSPGSSEQPAGAVHLPDPWDERRRVKARSLGAQGTYELNPWHDRRATAIEYGLVESAPGGSPGSSEQPAGAVHLPDPWDERRMVKARSFCG